MDKRLEPTTPSDKSAPRSQSQEHRQDFGNSQIDYTISHNQGDEFIFGSTDDFDFTNDPVTNVENLQRASETQGQRSLGQASLSQPQPQLDQPAHDENVPPLQRVEHRGAPANGQVEDMQGDSVPEQLGETQVEDLLSSSKSQEDRFRQEIYGSQNFESQVPTMREDHTEPAQNQDDRPIEQVQNPLAVSAPHQREIIETFDAFRQSTSQGAETQIVIEEDLHFSQLANETQGQRSLGQTSSSQPQAQLDEPARDENVLPLEQVAHQSEAAKGPPLDLQDNPAAGQFGETQIEDLLAQSGSNSIDRYFDQLSGSQILENQDTSVGEDHTRTTQHQSQRESGLPRDPSHEHETPQQDGTNSNYPSDPLQTDRLNELPDVQNLRLSEQPQSRQTQQGPHLADAIDIVPATPVQTREVDDDVASGQLRETNNNESALHSSLRPVKAAPILQADPVLQTTADLLPTPGVPLAAAMPSSESDYPSRHEHAPHRRSDSPIAEELNVLVAGTDGDLKPAARETAPRQGAGDNDAVDSSRQGLNGVNDRSGTSSTTDRLFDDRYAPYVDEVTSDRVPPITREAANPRAQSKQDLEITAERSEYRANWRHMQTGVNAENARKLFDSALADATAAKREDDPLARLPFRAPNRAAAVGTAPLPSGEGDENAPQELETTAQRKPRAKRKERVRVLAEPDENGWLTAKKHGPVDTARRLTQTDRLLKRPRLDNFLESAGEHSSDEPAPLLSRKKARTQPGENITVDPARDQSATPQRAEVIDLTGADTPSSRSVAGQNQVAARSTNASGSVHQNARQDGIPSEIYVYSETQSSDMPAPQRENAAMTGHRARQQASASSEKSIDLSQSDDDSVTLSEGALPQIRLPGSHASQQSLRSNSSSTSTENYAPAHETQLPYAGRSSFEPSGAERGSNASVTVQNIDRQQYEGRETRRIGLPGSHASQQSLESNSLSTSTENYAPSLETQEPYVARSSIEPSVAESGSNTSVSVQNVERLQNEGRSTRLIGLPGSHASQQSLSSNSSSTSTENYAPMGQAQDPYADLPSSEIWGGGPATRTGSSRQQTALTEMTTGTGSNSEVNSALGPPDRGPRNDRNDRGFSR